MKWYFRFDNPSVEEGSLQGPYDSEEDALAQKARIDAEMPGKTHDPFEDADELPVPKYKYTAHDGEYEVYTDGSVVKVS